MHSVGMKIGLWRKLFNSSIETTVLSHILRLANESFGYDNQVVSHSEKNWFMEQIQPGCTIDDAMKMGYNLMLSPGPKA